MANPTTTPVGRKVIMAAKFASNGVWGTEQAVDGTNGNVLLATGGVKNTKPGQYFAKASSTPYQRGELLLDAKGDAEVKGDLHYDGGLMALLFAAWGGDTKTGPTDISAYTHTASYSKTLTNIGTIGWYANETNGTVHVVPSVMIDKVTIDWKSNAPAKIDFKMIGTKAITNSATNVAANFTNLSVANDARNRPILNWHAETVASRNSGFVRIKKVTGAEGNCSSTDEIYVTGIKFSFDRKLKAADTQLRTPSQPVEEDQPQFKFEFEIPSYEGPIDAQGVINNLFKTDMQAQLDGTQADYKIDLYFESSTLAGSASAKYSLRFRCPRVAVSVDNPQVSGMGMLPTKVTCVCMEADAAANGTDWAGLTDPVNFVLVNQRATAYI